MFFADAVGNDTTLQVTVITTIGLVIVAIIGVFTAKITSGARREAIDNASAAADSAEVARDYAIAVRAKDAIIDSQNSRIAYLEEENRNLKERVDECERRHQEVYEQQRSSSLLERANAKEIAKLRNEISSIKKDKS